MFIKTTFNSDLNHILNCVNKCDFGTKCFAKVEHFVLRLICEYLIGGSYVTQNIEQAKKLHSSFVVFYFVFVLWLFSDVSRGTVFFDYLVVF